MGQAHPEKSTQPERNQLETSFLRAAKEGHVEPLRLLLDTLNAGFESALRKEAIELAKENGHTHIVEILQERAARNDNSPSEP